MIFEPNLAGNSCLLGSSPKGATKLSGIFSMQSSMDIAIQGHYEAELEAMVRSFARLYCARTLSARLQLNCT
jgi:hypothetical protein